MWYIKMMQKKEAFTMKKMLTLCILGVFLLSLTTSTGFSQTAKEILDKMIEASGGRKAIESVDDSTVTGTIELIQQGLSGTLTMYKKEPNKMRIDVEIMGMLITQAYDGEMAWWVNPQTLATEEMPETEAASMKRDALPRDSVFNPEKYGITFTYKGKEPLDGKDHYIIEQTYADGFKMTIYVNSETYLPTKSTGTVSSQMGELEFEQYASDYKKVNGLMIAHTVTTYINGEESRIIKISEIKNNTGLEDSLFKME
jgi:outer membrane lipoprotein-sorting protein